MYYVKDKLTTQYITLADGSFVAEWQKLEGRRLTSRRKRIGERLGITGSAISFPLPVYAADANGGLCIERRCVDALGVLGPAATNKLRRVYTGALLATTIITYQRG